jgi:SpoVK/Ycf46/Vps4 family AAA+-type ATPase
MATAELIKGIIRSYTSNQSEQFFAIALQIAAEEAKKGNKILAKDIRALVDKGKGSKMHMLAPLTPEQNSMLLQFEPKERLEDIVLSDDTRGRLNRILHEYQYRAKLEKHGLTHRRKILLAGPPGTGKTLTAAVLAGEMGLPLQLIMLNKIIASFLGETGAKLAKVFDAIKACPGVYFFDEFDAIGGGRWRENDVGEMRRVLNLFLQFLERDSSDSFIVAATNSPRMLDQALFRRFDDVLYYHLPDSSEIERLIEKRLGQFREEGMTFVDSVKVAETLSHAEIVQACDDAIKEVILDDKKIVASTLLQKKLQERRASIPLGIPSL